MYLDAPRFEERFPSSIGTCLGYGRERNLTALLLEVVAVLLRCIFPEMLSCSLGQGVRQGRGRSVHRRAGGGTSFPPRRGDERFLAGQGICTRLERGTLAPSLGRKSEVFLSGFSLLQRVLDGLFRYGVGHCLCFTSH